MHALTEKRVEKFARDYGFDVPLDKKFELYVAATYLYRYVKSDASLIEATVLGGGGDEGVDVAAVIVNNQIVMEPSDVENLIENEGNNVAKVIFIQAKTSEKFDSKLIAKFLHGVEMITDEAIGRGRQQLQPALIDVAQIIEKIAENGDRFRDTRIPCELYYVTTSGSEGGSVLKETQVQAALDRINDMQVYQGDLKLNCIGREGLAAKQKERLGPQNIKFNFEKRQTIPDADGVDEAYIGLISATELLKLLLDGDEPRAGIFDDNVRLHLGGDNPVNSKIHRTLTSGDLGNFPFLNNGLTVIATELNGMGDKFFISGYQIVNGGQTSHQLMLWATSAEVRDNREQLDKLWIPIKVISSKDPEVRSRVAVATNLQTPIGSSAIQAASSVAKDVEEFFNESGGEGLRYNRQERGNSLDFPQTRTFNTSDLNRAVASTIFGESAKAIASPKDLESENVPIWGDYPPQVFYYAAWIMYRIDRYLARTPDHSVLKAARYHFAMLVSVAVVPEVQNVFETFESPNDAKMALNKLKRKFDGIEKPGKLQKKIESVIPKIAKTLMDDFNEILSSGRSLRKDDVRSRRFQSELLARVTES